MTISIELVAAVIGVAGTLAAAILAIRYNKPVVVVEGADEQLHRISRTEVDAVIKTLQQTRYEEFGLGLRGSDIIKNGLHIILRSHPGPAEWVKAGPD